MQKITFGQVAPMGGYIASIILAFLWMDARHDIAGASERALLDAKTYTLTIAIADLASTITRYNTFEELGQLSDTNRVRRQELIDQREAYTNESVSLAQQKIALSQ